MVDKLKICAFGTSFQSLSLEEGLFKGIPSFVLSKALQVLMGTLFNL